MGYCSALTRFLELLIDAALAYISLNRPAFAAAHAKVSWIRRKTIQQFPEGYPPVFRTLVYASEPVGSPLCRDNSDAHIARWSGLSAIGWQVRLALDRLYDAGFPSRFL